MVVVPDASVLLKWVLPGDDEPHTKNALALRDVAIAGEIELIAPQLWVYEVGNTLARRFPERADELLALLIAFNLTEAVLDAEWRMQVLHLTATFGVTFYDASYHAAALTHGGLFVTADERYVRGTADAGGVTLLSRWEFVGGF